MRRTTTLQRIMLPSIELVEPLSKREVEVLQLLARGYTNQEIGQQLTIAESTVKMHIKHMYNKLNVHNRVQAILQARELQLLS